MPRLPCLACGKSISDTASACYSCGHRRSEPAPAAYAATQDADCPYYAVSVRKFAIMAVATFGMYEFYWAYKNWQRIQERTGESLRPFWRAWFAIFWSVSLFGRIRDDARQRGVVVTWSPAWLAAAYLILSVLWRLPGPWWLVTLLSFVPVLPVVQTIAALTRTQRSHTRGTSSTPPRTPAMTRSPGTAR
jgi:hypothetical protein